MANIFSGKLIERVQRTENVFSLKFELEENISFSPGQFVQLLFDEKDQQNKTLNKFLSISSSPQDKYIEVTKKISQSDFSKRLMALNKEERLSFKGPMGNCFFDGGSDKIGFVIGGIGITPVISILRNINNKKMDTDAVLLYANWKEKDIAFKDVLDDIQKRNSNIKVVHVLADEQKEGFKSGLIDQQFIKENMPDIEGRWVYIFGSPKMVEDFKGYCLKLGSDAKMIRSENFNGY